ncbi:MAG: hypothetical protein D6675_14620 [Gemmatimonadetes bacterium]|nr:MAG: hypothetical protein D6675_14620 [Gemmatimonadota bacterium]
MIGFLDDAKRPKIKLNVDGRRTSLSVVALIDTEFNGDLCLPVEVAVQLGLEPVQVVEVEKADGSIENTLVFSGFVEWFGESREVDILLTDAPESLIGTRLLEQTRMTIDFVEKMVMIENKAA